MAEWIEIARSAEGTDETETITVYADPDTIIKTGDRVQMWSLTDYKITEDASNATSAKQIDEHDCKGKRSRVLFIAFYSGHMGKGEAILIQNERVDWQQPLAGSVDEDILDFACRFRPKLLRTFTNMTN